MSLGTIALGCVFCIGFLIRGNGNASESPDVTMDLTSLVQKAFEHYDSGRFEASIQLLTKADRISPNQPDILELLAMTHLEANRPERALHFYERKLSLLSLGDTNDIATTSYSLGVVYTKLNQPMKAAAYYKVCYSTTRIFIFFMILKRTLCVTMSIIRMLTATWASFSQS